MGMTNEQQVAKYGYEDADAVAREDTTARSNEGRGDHEASARTNAAGFVRMPRRSSMKQKGAPRRASIQFGGEIEITLPGESEPVKRRTSIDFCTEPPQQVEEMSSSPNSPKDTKDLWMQQEDYDKIYKNNSKIVRTVEKGTDKNFCLRGLEGMMASSSQGKDRQDARNTVLEVQKGQRQKGIFNADLISESYRMIALESKLEAADRAEADIADVIGYIRRDRKLWKRQQSMRRLSC